jgi:hypothetical protein
MPSSAQLAYQILLHDQSWVSLAEYHNQLIEKTVVAGAYLQQQLQIAGIKDLSELTAEQFLNLLLQTKKPQIFAESAVYGGGTDWNRQELKLLGDIGVACEVTIYDDGRHQNPAVHEIPFMGYLLFTPGALLRNGRNQTPADWDVVNDSGQIDIEHYYALYERRLLPLLLYANNESRNAGKKAVITIPGLGCGQFAGKFAGQLGEKLEAVLERMLRTYRSELDAVELVFFDPYLECSPKTYDVEGLPFVVNPQTKSSKKLNQLSYPYLFVNGENSDNLILFSFVAWDHVSWPGNDFYQGCRVTDDGVKAAATNSMYAMTGIQGYYDSFENCYLPPLPFRTWAEVVQHHNLRLSA